jgi:hypothetical protein
MMPWDNTELWTVELNADGAPIETTRQCISTDEGKILEEAVLQPEWSPCGLYVYFLSDRNDRFLFIV